MERKVKGNFPFFWPFFGVEISSFPTPIFNPPLSTRGGLFYSDLSPAVSGKLAAAMPARVANIPIVSTGAGTQ